LPTQKKKKKKKNDFYRTHSNLQADEAWYPEIEASAHPELRERAHINIKNICHEG
jgi:hypothetical protein